MHYNYPTIEEYYTIVNNTVRFNQGLPDERFKIDYVKSATSALQSARSNVDAAMRRGPAKTPQAKVDEVVNQADRQKVELEASAPSREWASGATIGAASLGAVGILTLATAWFLKRRG